MKRRRAASFDRSALVNHVFVQCNDVCMDIVIVNKSRFFFDVLFGILTKDEGVGRVHFGCDEHATHDAIIAGIDVAIFSPHSMEASVHHRQKWGTGDFPYKRVVTTTDVDVPFVLNACRLGFDGVLDLAAPSTSFVDYLRRVVSGQEKLAVHPYLANSRVDIGSLTDSRVVCHDATDVHIIDLLAMGLSDKEIAASVYLSCQTVRNRISRMLQDSDARNRTQLAVRHIRKNSLEVDARLATLATSPPLSR